SYAPAAPAYNYPAPAASTNAPASNSLPGGEQATTSPTQRASVTIHAPESAQVWFAGVKATKKGAKHDFRTQPLNPQEQTSYTAKARWTTEDGKQVVRSKTVRLHGGQHAVVNFGEN